MTLLTPANVLNAASPQKPEKKHRKRDHVVGQKGRNVIVAIDPGIVDAFGLVPGQYLCHQEIEGLSIRMTFRKKEALLA